jgi:hypothetical protein
VGFRNLTMVRLGEGLGAGVDVGVGVGVGRGAPERVGLGAGGGAGRVTVISSDSADVEIGGVWQATRISDRKVPALG